MSGTLQDGTPSRPHGGVYEGYKGKEVFGEWEVGTISDPSSETFLGSCPFVKGTTHFFLHKGKTGNV